MAHAAAPAPGSGPVVGPGTGARNTVLLALLLGAVYGIWAAANHRSGGPVTAGNVLLGLVAGVAFAAVWFGLRTVSERLPREQRALAWAAFTGLAFGYLYSAAGGSVLRSIGNAALVAGAVGCALFYRYYTREDE